MSDLKSQLRDYVDANIERVDVDDLASMVLTQPETRPLPQRVRPAWLARRPLAVAGMAAMMVVLVIGVAWLVALGSEDSPVVTRSPTPSSTVQQASTTILPAEGSWNPLLSTTHAKAAPPAATCPEGAEPDSPGPIDQERPGPGPWNNQSAVFDQHIGRILFVDDRLETWTFDVCSNTWRQMNPRFVPPDPAAWQNEIGVSALHGVLVYDVDSDRTVAFGSDALGVYDASANTWTLRNKPPEFELVGASAVYDPVSGLVLVQAASGLVAYDTEDDEWAFIGVIDDGSGYPPFLVGHLVNSDRLAFLKFVSAPYQGSSILLDPRNGAWAGLSPPFGEVAGGFGSLKYATSGETAYTFGDDGVCRLDPEALDWTCSRGSTTQLPSAIVYDAVNDRLVLINDWCCLWPGVEATDDVWAVDLATGDWAQLLARSDESTGAN